MVGCLRMDASTRGARGFKAMSEYKQCPLVGKGGVNKGKKAFWEYKPDPYEWFDKIPVCSACGCTTKFRDAPKICPNCGADMTEPPKENA